MAGNNIFDRIAFVFGRKRDRAGSAEIAALLDETRDALARADTAIAEFREGRATAVLAGDEARREFRRRLAELEADRADAAAAVEEVERRLATVVEAEAEAERRRKHGHAMKLQAEAAKMLVDQYPSLARKLVDIVKTMALADIAIDDANRALPAGELPLDHVDAFARALGAKPGRILSDEVVECWVRDGSTTPAPDKIAAKIEPKTERRGIHRNVLTFEAAGADGPIREHHHRADYYSLRRFRRREIEEVAPADFPRELTASIALPGLRAGDSAFWTPIDPLTADTAGEAVLRHIDRLAQEGPELARDKVKTLRRIEFTLIPDEPEGEPAVAEAAE